MNDNFAFADSRAAGMLREGLHDAKTQRRLSARQIAFNLGYKQPVVLSHMAAGRVPIPLERAMEIAEAVGINSSTFLLATIEQREPKVCFALENVIRQRSQPDEFSEELSVIAGGQLAELSDDHKRVLREVVADRRPSDRWLATPEIPLVHDFRQAFPRMSTEGLGYNVVREIIGITAERWPHLD